MTWRPASRAGRVLLTHLQMGYDRDATIESVRARFDGPVELVDPGFETHRSRAERQVARHETTEAPHQGWWSASIGRRSGSRRMNGKGGNEPTDRRPPEGSDDRLGVGA